MSSYHIIYRVCNNQLAPLRCRANRSIEFRIIMNSLAPTNWHCRYDMSRPRNTICVSFFTVTVEPPLNKAVVRFEMVESCWLLSLAVARGLKFTSVATASSAKTLFCLSFRVWAFNQSESYACCNYSGCTATATTIRNREKKVVMIHQKFPRTSLLCAVVFYAIIQQTNSQSTNSTAFANATNVSTVSLQQSQCGVSESGIQCQSNVKSTDKLLSRRKRYIAFPEGSSFSVNNEWCSIECLIFLLEFISIFLYICICYDFVQVAFCETLGFVGNPQFIYFSWAINWGIAYELPNQTWIINNRNRKPLPKQLIKRRHRRDLYNKLEIAIDKWVLCCAFFFSFRRQMLRLCFCLQYGLRWTRMHFAGIVREHTVFL